MKLSPPSGDAQALEALRGLQIASVDRAADTLCLQFGPIRTVAGHEGRLRRVGEQALHLQCPWRFVRSGEIILASTDFYYDPQGKKDFDWEREESLFDRHAAALNEFLAAIPSHVAEVSPRSCHAFQLTFTPDFHFAVFPASSYRDPEYGEHWRLFQPALGRPHYVSPFGWDDAAPRRGSAG